MFVVFCSARSTCNRPLLSFLNIVSKKVFLPSPPPMYFISQRRPLFDEPCLVRLSPAIPDNRDLPTGGNTRLFQSKSGLGEHFSRPQRCDVLPFAPQRSL